MRVKEDIAEDEKADGGKYCIASVIPEKKHCCGCIMSNFYSPLNGRSTYINTKTIQWQYEKQKNNTTYT